MGGILWTVAEGRYSPSSFFSQLPHVTSDAWNHGASWTTRLGGSRLLLEENQMRLCLCPPCSNGASQFYENFSGKEGRMMPPNFSLSLQPSILHYFLHISSCLKLKQTLALSGSELSMLTGSSSSRVLSRGLLYNLPLLGWRFQGLNLGHSACKKECFCAGEGD